MLLATCRVSRVTCQVCDVPAYTTCEYCDLEQKLCKPGCETDDNCAAGDVCVSHNCAAGAGSAAACHVSRVTCHVSRSGGERDREHHHQHRVLLRLYRLRQPHRLRGGRRGRVPPGGAAGHQQQQHPALVRANTAPSVHLWAWTIWRWWTMTMARRHFLTGHRMMTVTMMVRAIYSEYLRTL